MVTENDLNKLRALQDVISEKIRLESGIQEIPKQLLKEEDTLTKLKKDFIDLNKKFEEEKAKESEIKLMLVEVGILRENSEKNTANTSTQREFEAVQKEIDDAKKKESDYNKDLQKKKLVVAELDEQIKIRAQLIEDQEKEVVAKRATVEEQLNENRGQLEGLMAEEGRLTQELDTEVVFKFERIIRNKQGIGIVAIKGNVCMGCHMILPTQFANSVRLGQEFIFCHYCSRILFYEESADEDFFDTEHAGSLSDLDDIEEDEEEEEEDDPYEEEEEVKLNIIDYEE
ncbi:MAG: C4-type zinc ribbon domain-containing protein [Spirochaetes bacterium]|nr:C4-type zinc ribbon domain-containing protein [Spirochaetota bacterium]